MLNKLDQTLVNELFNEALTFELKKYAHIPVSYQAENTPSTGKSIADMFTNSKRYGSPFRIFNGANEEKNLYFTPETNLLYRTLHDYHHAELYISRMGGTTKISHELKLNCKMAWLAYSYAISRYDLSLALAVFFAVYHDTVGQVLYYKETKSFIENQKALTVTRINCCKGVEMLKSGRISQAVQVMQSYCLECGFSG